MPFMYQVWASRLLAALFAAWALVQLDGGHASGLDAHELFWIGVAFAFLAVVATFLPRAHSDPDKDVPPR